MVNCPTCGDRFDSLGAHFRYHADHRPALSERQLAIADYLVLRGASVRREGSYPYLEVYGTAESQLGEIADALAWAANDVRAHDTDRAGERRDLWAFKTLPHPSFDYDGATDVTELRPLTLRLIVAQCGRFVGDLFGSLWIDLRGFDVSGDRLRTLLRRGGVATVEYEGDGYATDSHTARYHYHTDVVVVPHYDAVALLDSVGLELSDVADPLNLG